MQKLFRLRTVDAALVAMPIGMVRLRPGETMLGDRRSDARDFH